MKRELTEAEMLGVQAATRSAAKRFFTRSMRSSGIDREDIASEGKLLTLRYFLSREDLPDDLSPHLVTTAKCRTLNAIDQQNRRRNQLWRTAYSLDMPRPGPESEDDDADDGNLLSSGPEEPNDENARLDLKAALAAYEATLADNRLAVYLAFKEDTSGNLPPLGRIRRIRAALRPLGRRQIEKERAALQHDLAPLASLVFSWKSEKHRASSWSDAV